jgi:hypothetical protein
MQPTLERGLVISALEMALLQRRPVEGELICHSDPVTCGDWGQSVRQRRLSEAAEGVRHRLFDESTRQLL